eukprot:gene4057-20233_t
MTLCPSKDLTLFLWGLKDTLRKAEPGLSDTHFNTLICRQFMKALPSDLQLKLLESDPTPNLDTMLKFAKRIRASRTWPWRGGDLTKCATLPADCLSMTILIFLNRRRLVLTTATIVRNPSSNSQSGWPN